MRRLFVFWFMGFGSLISVAAAQVSTDDGGGISSLHRGDDIPPGRQATEGSLGDGIDADDVGNIEPDLNTEPRQSYRARAESNARSGHQGIGERNLEAQDIGAQPEAALGTLPAESRPAQSRAGQLGHNNRRARAAVAKPRGGRPENRWRYQNYNGYWWYWTPNNRWAFFGGGRWIDYNSELANQWARGGAVGSGEMGLGGGGYGLGGSYGASGMNGMLGGGTGNGPSLGGMGRLGTNAGGLGSAQIPGRGTAPGRSAIPSFRGGGGSMAAGGLGPTGAGGSLSGGAGGAAGGGVTGEGLGSSLFGNSGGMAAVPGLSGTRGSLGGASGVGITAGGTGARSGDANSGVGGGMVGGAGIGGTGGARGGIGAGN